MQHKLIKDIKINVFQSLNSTDKVKANELKEIQQVMRIISFLILKSFRNISFTESYTVVSQQAYSSYYLWYLFPGLDIISPRANPEILGP